MLYFIPAWYQQDDWKESEEVWYRSRTVTEFDDTVKQIQLFFRKGKHAGGSSQFFGGNTWLRSGS